jgi:mono/diheme cytochrome c family protein
MRWKLTALVVGVAALIALAAVVRGQQSGLPEGLTVLGEPVTIEQVAFGRKVYSDNCASCHGANLQGQPDWKRRLDNGRMRAPPHDESGHTWHHSDRALLTITKGGLAAVAPNYESDMPAFESKLSDEEIAAVLAYIKARGPIAQGHIRLNARRRNPL